MKCASTDYLCYAYFKKSAIPSSNRLITSQCYCDCCGFVIQECLRESRHHESVKLVIKHARQWSDSSNNRRFIKV